MTSNSHNRYVDDPVLKSGKLFSAFRNMLLVLVLLVPLAAQAKKKIVVFSIGWGNGHTAAAAAIKDKLVQQYGTDIEVVEKSIDDFVKDKVKRKQQEEAYIDLVKNHPDKYSEKWARGKQSWHKMDGIYSGDIEGYDTDAIAKYLNDQGAELSIGLHHLVPNLLRKLKLENKIPKTKVGFVFTDYYDAPFLSETAKHIDVSFVGSEALRKKWIDRGVPPDRVITSGIPINPLINEKIDRDKFLRDNGFDPTIKTIVIAGGGEGIGPLGETAKSIKHEYGLRGEKVQVVIVTGKNEKIYNEITGDPELAETNFFKLKVFKSLPNTEYLNYVKSCDLYITKSGGLSPTEGAVIGKPMILFDVLGGHETDNANFYEEIGIGKIARPNQFADIGKWSVELLGPTGNTARDKMLEAQVKFSNERQPQKIITIAKQIADTGSPTAAAIPPVSYYSGDPLKFNDERAAVHKRIRSRWGVDPYGGGPYGGYGSGPYGDGYGSGPYGDGSDGYGTGPYDVGPHGTGTLANTPFPITLNWNKDSKGKAKEITLVQVQSAGTTPEGISFNVKVGKKVIKNGQPIAMKATDLLERLDSVFNLKAGKAIGGHEDPDKKMEIYKKLLNSKNTAEFMQVLSTSLCESTLKKNFKKPLDQIKKEDIAELGSDKFFEGCLLDVTGPGINPSEKWQINIKDLFKVKKDGTLEQGPISFDVATAKSEVVKNLVARGIDSSRNVLTQIEGANKLLPDKDRLALDPKFAFIKAQQDELTKVLTCTNCPVPSDNMKIGDFMSHIVAISSKLLIDDSKKGKSKGWEQINAEIAGNIKKDLCLISGLADSCTDDDAKAKVERTVINVMADFQQNYPELKIHELNLDECRIKSETIPGKDSAPASTVVSVPINGNPSSTGQSTNQSKDSNSSLDSSSPEALRVSAGGFPSGGRSSGGDGMGMMMAMMMMQNQQPQQNSSFMSTMMMMPFMMYGGGRMIL